MGGAASTLENRFRIPNNLDKFVKLAEINMAKFSNTTCEVLQESQMQMYNMGKK